MFALSWDPAVLIACPASGPSSLDTTAGSCLRVVQAVAEPCNRLQVNIQVLCMDWKVVAMSLLPGDACPVLRILPKYAPGVLCATYRQQGLPKRSLFVLEAAYRPMVAGCGWHSQVMQQGGWSPGPFPGVTWSSVCTAGFVKLYMLLQELVIAPCWGVVPAAGTRLQCRWWKLNEQACLGMSLWWES